MGMTSIKRKTGGEGGAGQVQSLVRGLGILQCLAGVDGGATLTDIAQATGLAPSTTHRLLHSLEQERFARHDPESGRWHVEIGRATSELQSLMRISYAVFCLKKKKRKQD